MTHTRILPIAALLLAPLTASAQVNPYFRPGAAGGNIVTTQATPAVPFNRSFAPNPYGNPGMFPGAWGNFIPPGGAYLMGAADIINAQGQFLQDRQQASIMREQFKQAKLDTQRKAFDQRMYELANTPKPSQVREMNRQEMVARAMSAPPQTEISSGYALNTLLTNIQLISPSGIQGPMVPIPDGILQRINVTAPTSGASNSTAMLRNGGKISWPVPLQDTPFDPLRKKIDATFAAAVENFMNGRIDAALIRQLTTDIETMQVRVKAMVASYDMDSTDFMDCKRFLTSLSSSVAGLRDPALAQVVAAQQQLRGGNVFELANYMTQNGLQFAPAGPNDDGAYFALHHALVSYNVLLMGQQQAMQAKPTPKE